MLYLLQDHTYGPFVNARVASLITELISDNNNILNLKPI